jgi:hypothetical protein
VQEKNKKCQRRVDVHNIVATTAAATAAAVAIEEEDTTLIWVARLLGVYQKFVLSQTPCRRLRRRVHFMNTHSLLLLISNRPRSLSCRAGPRSTRREEASEDVSVAELPPLTPLLQYRLINFLFSMMPLPS